MLEMFGSINVVLDNFEDVFQSIKFTGRLAYWELSLDLWHKNIWFGNGWGNNNEILFKTFEIEQTHNDYIRILSDLGVIGLFLYLLIFIIFIKRIYKSNSKYKIYLLYLIISYLIIGLTDNFISYICYFFPYILIFFKLDKINLKVI